MIIDDFEAIARQLERIQQEERRYEQEQQNADEPVDDDDDQALMHLSDWF